MDAIECGITSLGRAIKFWGILVISFSDHLNGKTRNRKNGPLGVLTKEEDEVVVTWVLNMQACGLSITLQQLKWKVAKVIQTQPTAF